MLSCEDEKEKEKEHCTMEHEEESSGVMDKEDLDELKKMVHVVLLREMIIIKKIKKWKAMAMRIS